MTTFFTIDQINELVVQSHSYISRIGIKIINDKNTKGSSNLEDFFYEFLELLEVVEERKDIETTDDRLQNLVLRLYGYVENECVYYNGLYVDLDNPMFSGSVIVDPDIYIHKAGVPQTITSPITFSNPIIIPNGTTTYQAVNLGQLEAAIPPSGNYIDNQNISAQDANGWISGVFEADGGFSINDSGGNTLVLNATQQYMTTPGGGWYTFNMGDTQNTVGGNLIIFGNIQSTYAPVVANDIVRLSDLSAYTPTLSLTTTGNSGVSTYIGNILNIPAYTLSGLDGQPQLNGTGFVKASGTTISYDNSTYLTTIAAASAYVPYTGASGNVNIGSNTFTASNITGTSINATTGFYSNYTTYGGALEPQAATLSNSADGSFAQYKSSIWLLKDVTTGFVSTFQLDANTVASNINIVFQGHGGTVAYTSDVPSLSGYVPYSGATTTLNMGTQTIQQGTGTTTTAINPGSIELNSPSGNIGITSSSGNSSMSATGVTVAAPSLTSYLSLKVDSLLYAPMGDGFPTQQLHFTSVTSSRDIYLPDNSGTVALLSDIPSGLPPTGSAGGDLTGTYPNPTINTINSITKGYYDPTSSIQTQLNSKLSTTSASTTYVPYSGATGTVNLNTQILEAGSIGIGTGSNIPAGMLQSVSTSSATIRGALFDQFSNDTSGSKILGRKSRGTLSSPVVIVSGDNLFGLNGSGWDGTQFTDATRIVSSSAGTISTGIIPGTLALQTSNASGTMVNGLFIDQSQNITMGHYGAGIAQFSSSGLITSGTVSNAQLATSTISGIALGNNLSSLTLGTGLTGSSYNGSGAVSSAVDQTFTPTWTGIHTFQKGIVISGGQTLAAWGQNAPLLQVAAQTVVDNSTAAGATVTNITGNVIGIPTFTAANATSGSKVTYTNAYTFQILGIPVAGANTLFTNTASLDVVAGMSLFGGGFSTTSSITTSNLFGVAANLVTISSQAQLQFVGSSNIYTRSGANAIATSTMTTAGTNYANFIIGSSPITTSASGTNALLANMVINPIGTVTSGGATVTSTASLYINGAGIGGTSNYSLWVTGLERHDGLFNFGGVSGTAGQVPIVNAGATALTWLTLSQPTHGNSTTTGAATTAVTVTIGSTMSGINYFTSITPRDTLTGVNFYISAQTTTTFTITFLTALTGSINFDWMVTP